MTSTPAAPVSAAVSSAAVEIPMIIAGGGTGGHLFPGLALADALTAHGARITFVGTARGIEARAVPKAGYPLELIDVAGLKGQGLLGTVRSLLRLPLAAWQALQLIRRLRPRVVIGVGGYASGPLVLLAALSGIPTVVLEQNSIPGVTNRLLGKLARRIFTAFPDAERFFPRAKVELCGNPIRLSVLAQSAAALPSLSLPAGLASSPPLRVLVLGGSQGARAVNQLVQDALAHWLQNPPTDLPLATALQLRHQTGTSDEASVSARYRELGLPSTVARAEAFITDMGQAYTDCDLMIGRAGATTIAELTAVGRPALLIPFPQAADDHQTFNARSMVQQGAALLFPQHQTSPQQLAEALQRLCRQRTELAQMATASRALGRPDAAQVIATKVLALCASP